MLRQKLICILLSAASLAAMLLLKTPGYAVQQEMPAAYPAPPETVLAAENEAPAEEAVTPAETAQPVPPSAQSEPEPLPSAPAAEPELSAGDWELLLINAQHPCAGYVPVTEEVEGQQVDARMAQALRDMIAAARADGIPIYIASAYRTEETQSYLYQRALWQGMSSEEAALRVGIPGETDHHTALACDILDCFRETKDESFDSTDTFLWLSVHGAEYGFVLRYPQGKQEVTGTSYEPWHFRYVGVQTAQYMVENGLCLEELAAQLSENAS